MQVQLWLGHRSAAFTLDTYTHLLPTDLPRDFSPVDGLPEPADDHETTTAAVRSGEIDLVAPRSEAA